MDGVDRFGIARSPEPATPVVPPQAPDTGMPDRFGIVHAPVAAVAVGATDEVAAGAAVTTMAAPTRWQPPPPPTTWQPQQEAARTGSLGAWGVGSTGYTVIGAILLGGLLQFVFYLLDKNGHVEPEALVRYAIVGTVAFYCVVAVIVIQRLNAGRVRLFWTDGKPLLGVLTGAGIGLSLGLVGLGITSSIAGHLSTDPGIMLMTSEGDAAHILAACSRSPCGRAAEQKRSGSPGSPSPPGTGGRRRSGTTRSWAHSSPSSI